MQNKTKEGILFRYKGFKILLTFLLALSILFLLLIIYVGILHNNRKSILNTKAANSYDFHNGEILSENDKDYTDNSLFYIRNKRGLNNFAKSVQYAGVDFAEKVIELECDIDYEGEEFAGIGVKSQSPIYFQQFFAGTFNGNGHIVSNFSITVNLYLNAYEQRTLYTLEETGEDWHEGETGVGFFAGLTGKATVSGLGIKNATFKTPEKWEMLTSHNLYIGGIVGYIEGDTTIMNCCVDGLVLNRYTPSLESTGYSPTALYVGGIVGCAYGPAKISFCYVSKLQSNLRDWYTDEHYTGFGQIDYCPGAFCGANYQSKDKGYVSNCVFVDTESHCATNDTQFKYAIYPGGNVGNDVYMESDGNFSNLNYVGDEGGESSSLMWYFVGEGYNDGYPKLKAFIDWEPLNFIPGDNFISMISPTSIEVPSDCSFSNQTGQSITILGRSIEAMLLPNYNATYFNWTYYDKPNTYNIKHYLVTSDAKANAYYLSFSRLIGAGGVRIDCEGEYREEMDGYLVRTFDGYQGFLDSKTGEEKVFAIRTQDAVSVQVEWYQKNNQTISIADKKYEVKIFKSITFEFDYLDTGGYNGHMRIKFYLYQGEEYVLYCGFIEGNNLIYQDVTTTFYLTEDMASSVSGYSICINAEKKFYNMTLR